MFLCLCFLTGCVWGSVYWFRMTGSSGDLRLIPEGKGKHLAFRWFYPSEKLVYSLLFNSYLLNGWDILLCTVWGTGEKDTRAHRNNWLPSVTEGFKTGPTSYQKVSSMPRGQTWESSFVEKWKDEFKQKWAQFTETESLAWEAIKWPFLKKCNDLWPCHHKNACCFLKEEK